MSAREFHDGAKDGLEALEPLIQKPSVHSTHCYSPCARLRLAGVVWVKPMKYLDDDRRPRLFGRDDPVRRDDDRQDGQDHQHDDRSRDGAMCRLDRGVDCTWAQRISRQDPLSSTIRRMSDEELFQKGYNRVYDTLEMEANLNYVEHVVGADDETDQPRTAPFVSKSSLANSGRRLRRNLMGDGILKSAYLKKVPVYIPAFTDSEMGLDVGTWAMGRAIDQARAQTKGGSDLDILRAINRSYPSFNPYQDLNSYTDAYHVRQAARDLYDRGRSAANWSQQVGPYIEISNMRSGA